MKSSTIMEHNEKIYILVSRVLYIINRTLGKEVVEHSSCSRSCSNYYYYPNNNEIIDGANNEKL